jgi:hypothetical protein
VEQAGTPALDTAPVQRHVACHPVQPGREPASPLELAQPDVQPEQHQLCDIVRVVRVVRYPCCPAMYLCLHARHQLVERGGAALFRASDEHTKHVVLVGPGDGQLTLKHDPETPPGWQVLHSDHQLSTTAAGC